MAMQRINSTSVSPWDPLFAISFSIALLLLQFPIGGMSNLGARTLRTDFSSQSGICFALIGDKNWSPIYVTI
jgi:hypothetical protein